MHDDIHGLCVLCTAFRKYIQQHSVFHLKRGSDKMKRYVGACVSGDVCIKIRVKVACIYPSSAQTLLILLATSFACQSSDFFIFTLHKRKQRQNIVIRRCIRKISQTL